MDTPFSKDDKKNKNKTPAQMYRRFVLPENNSDSDSAAKTFVADAMANYLHTPLTNPPKPQPLPAQNASTAKMSVADSMANYLGIPKSNVLKPRPAQNSSAAKTSVVDVMAKYLKISEPNKTLPSLKDFMGNPLKEESIRSMLANIDKAASNSKRTGIYSSLNVPDNYWGARALEGWNNAKSGLANAVNGLTQHAVKNYTPNPIDNWLDSVKISDFSKKADEVLTNINPLIIDNWSNWFHGKNTYQDTQNALKNQKEMTPETVNNWAKNISVDAETQNKAIADKYKDVTGGKKVAGDIVSGVVGYSPTIAGTALNPAVGVATAFGQGYGSKRREGELKNLPSDKIDQYALLNGLVDAITQALIPGSSGVKGGIQGGLKGTLKSAGKTFFKDAAIGAGSNISKGITDKVFVDHNKPWIGQEGVISPNTAVEAASFGTFGAMPKLSDYLLGKIGNKISNYGASKSAAEPTVQLEPKAEPILLPEKTEPPKIRTKTQNAKDPSTFYVSPEGIVSQDINSIPKSQAPLALPEGRMQPLKDYLDSSLNTNKDPFEISSKEPVNAQNVYEKPDIINAHDSSKPASLPPLKDYIKNPARQSKVGMQSLEDNLKTGDKRIAVTSEPNTLKRSTEMLDDVVDEIKPEGIRNIPKSSAESKAVAERNIANNRDNVIRKIYDSEKITGETQAYEAAILTKELYDEAKQTGSFQKLNTWAKNIAEKTKGAERAEGGTNAVWDKISPERALIKAQKEITKAAGKLEESNPEVFNNINKDSASIDNVIKTPGISEQGIKDKLSGMGHGDLADQIIGAVKSGQYDIGTVKDLLKQKSGIPVLTEEDAKLITDTMEAAAKFPEGSTARNDAIDKVRAFIEGKIVDKANTGRISLLNNNEMLDANIAGNDTALVSLDEFLGKNAGTKGALNVEGQGKGVVEGVSKVNFTYRNNPIDNPKAAKDIIENSDAVYGYSPKPGSSLDEFVNKIDWTNPEQVADARLQRTKYHEGLEIQKANLDQEVNKLLKEGHSLEGIARMKVSERNSHRIEMYIKKGNYEGLEAMKARNMKQYQNPDGPTPEQLLEKYGSWEEVIYASVRSNPGMDACTGLYDIYGGN